MFKAKKLDKLVAAGIISAEQSQQILEFEKKNSAANISRFLMILGVFVACLGVISVVASNWNRIGDAMKLFVMFAVLFSAGFKAWRWENAGLSERAEIMLAAIFLLVGAAIGLIIQIYNLSGEKGYAVLAVWCLVSSPILAIAKQKYFSGFWVPVFLTWWACCLFDVLHADNRSMLTQYPYGGDVLIMILSFAVFVFLGKMIMLYASSISFGKVLHKDALFAAYLTFALYIFSGGWGSYETQIVKLLTALGLLFVSSLIYKHYRSYDLVYRNIKFAGLVIVVFYIDTAARLGLLTSGIGLILSGIGLIFMVKYWPKVSASLIGEQKHD